MASGQVLHGLTDGSNAGIVLVVAPVGVGERDDPPKVWPQIETAHGAELVEGPYVAETVPVHVEEDYIVVEM